MTAVTEEPDMDMLQLELEEAYEALSDVRRYMAQDEAGWASGLEDTLGRDYIKNQIKVAKKMAIYDPLVRRGVSLRIAYVWGEGCAINADNGGEGQDLNAIVQQFLKDPGNISSITSGQAHEEMERGLATEGERFFALATNAETGRVVVRNIPALEVEEIINNPEDAAEPWFYKRVYTTKKVISTGINSLRTQTVQRTVYYPAVDYQPKQRASLLEGKPIDWTTPILHVRANRMEGSHGTPDVLAALPWAQGYKTFLEDWARLIRALSRFAFQATASNKKGAQQIRSKMAMGDDVGQTAIMPEGHKLEAIGKSGATIDSRSGFPLAAMVASALDVPATILTADPGVTGARATAETLDRPFELVINMRRDLWISAFERILNYVVDQAVKANRLRGTIVHDKYTDREVIKLADDQPRIFNIDFPDLSSVSLDVLMEAIERADGMGKIPPLVIARMILVALREDNVDDILDGLQDEDGNFLDPYLDVNEQTGTDALNAWRNGQQNVLR